MKKKIIIFHVIPVISVITSVIFPRRKTVATTDFEVVREKSIMVLPRQRVVLGGHGDGLASYTAVTCGAPCGARVQRLKLRGATYERMQEGEVLTEVSVLM